MVLINSSCRKAEAVEVDVVSVEEMHTHLKYNQVQVDVESRSDFQESHILNAQQIINDKAFKIKLDGLDKSQPVAIYCTSGEYSPEAAKLLQQIGFERIYILDGGIKKWISEDQQVKALN